MRQFASSGFRIWNLGREAKVLYTAFCLFALAGYASSVVYYEDLIGRAGCARNYYAGAPAVEALPRAAGTPGAPGGPSIELPPEAAGPAVEPISYRHLLEVTHFHLFTVPVFLLIVGHLFMLTGLGPTSKLVWLVLASASALLHLAAPWWVRYTGSGAPSVPITGVLMLGSFGFMTAYSAWAMWAGDREPRSDKSPP